MVNELSYPFDAEHIFQKKRAIKNELLNDGTTRIEVNIAVLGGSTTDGIVKILELFLLDYGIMPHFYESEYGKFFEDAVFGNSELDSFKPDIIYIHTSNRNVTRYPTPTTSKEETEKLIEAEYARFHKAWECASARYGCPIIQNNFEPPYYRVLGNMDAWASCGRTNFLTRLNMMFYEYAQSHNTFYINDLNYLASSYGIHRWASPDAWHLYKYALRVQAIPYLSFSVANIIKSIYGKNKKALVVDLDNTLWGGVISEDGENNIEIGQESAIGQVFSEFQTYVKSQKDIGVILAVNSKNDYDNAVLGLSHRDGVLKPSDFAVIKANWMPKNVNIDEIAKELNIARESLVFADDNPAERLIVEQNCFGVSVPPLQTPEEYIRLIDGAGYFEQTSLSVEDARRAEMYLENRARQELLDTFDNYDEYLASLEMSAEIKAIDAESVQRVTQLANKSNQFNLTTRRYTISEVEEISQSDDYIAICGRLSDRFGDNGIVSVVIGNKTEDALNIKLWIMSCRVLKRGMEYLMLDELVKRATDDRIKTIRGFYYKTPKNSMVASLYGELGFTLVSGGDDSVWEMDTSYYKQKNKFIRTEQI